MVKKFKKLPTDRPQPLNAEEKADFEAQKKEQITVDPDVPKALWPEGAKPQNKRKFK